MSRLQLVLSVLLGAALVMAPATGQAAIRYLELEDAIHRVTAEYLCEGIDAANREGDALVVIRLETPGGLFTSTETIIQKILGSEVPVAVFVAPSGARAASAGFYITLAADVAIMAPGTNIGAATPVQLSKKIETNETMDNKIISDASARIRSIAEQRGRNVELAEKAVTESLSWTDTEALENNLIDFICRDLDEVIATLEGREISRPPDRTITLQLKEQAVIRSEMNWRQRLLSFIANPEIAFALLTLGGIGLLVEIYQPGLILPGVFGLLCLVLAAFAFSILPVNILGLVLIILGIILFAAEVKVTSYGFLTLTGIISLLFGSLMLIDGPIPAMRVSLRVVLPIVLTMALVVIFLLRMVVASHRRQVSTGMDGLVGKLGTVRHDLAPRGKVAVHGELWDAVSDETIPAGEEVEVIRVGEGMVLRVKRRVRSV